MKRLRVKFACDGPYGDYHKGDVGFVDGYVRGGNDVPYAVIVMKDTGRFVMAELHNFVMDSRNDLDNE